ncbi:hypothetical protein M2351_003860 [Azospirillum canadense]|nr:hypothetical protein [Azospirillum canadense]
MAYGISPIRATARLAEDFGTHRPDSLAWALSLKQVCLRSVLNLEHC